MAHKPAVPCPSSRCRHGQTRRLARPPRTPRLRAIRPVTFRPSVVTRNLLPPMPPPSHSPSHTLTPTHLRPPVALEKPEHLPHPQVHHHHPPQGVRHGGQAARRVQGGRVPAAAGIAVCAGVCVCVCVINPGPWVESSLFLSLPPSLTSAPSPWPAPPAQAPATSAPVPPSYPLQQPPPQRARPPLYSDRLIICVIQGAHIVVS